MLETQINSKFAADAAINELVNDIDRRFELGELLKKGSRNTLRCIDLNGKVVVAKHFGVPNAFNGIVYSFLRKPKCVRAYEYALRVRAKGFDTPEPLAYIIRKHCGIIADSYLLTDKCAYRRNFYEFGNADISECEDIVRAFARWAAALHGAGILHRDFSPGNILFDSVGGEWRFAIVDINRMSFGHVSIERGCENFARLWGQLPFFKVIADEYAAARNADSDYCYRVILKARRKFWTRFSRHHKVKYRLEL